MNLRSAKWTIEFSWIKAHAGNLRNKPADHLAKDAASEKDIAVFFDRIPKTTLYSALEEEATLKGHEELKQCKKAAVNKQLFLNLRDRINRRKTINPNFTAPGYCHSKTKSYNYRFKVMYNATCPCNTEYQTPDHVHTNH